MSAKRLRVRPKAPVELFDHEGNLVCRLLHFTLEVPTSGGEGASSVSSSSTRAGDSQRVSEEIETVWAHYVEVMNPRAKKLDSEARRIIADALKVATVVECCSAIDGCRASTFHMGDNDRGRKYNRLSQILKGKRASAQGPGRTTREQIDLFLDIAAKSGVQSGVTSASPARVRQAKEQVRNALTFPGDAEVVKRGEESAAWLATHGIRLIDDRWVVGE